MLDLVVRGGRVVLRTGLADADIGIADVLVVLPGAVDPHVHIHTRFGDWTTLDDFYSGTAPAAIGGTTSIIEFAIPEPGETTLGAIKRCLAEAAGSAVVDYTFHACVAGHRFAQSVDEIRDIPSTRVRSV